MPASIGLKTPLAASIPFPDQVPPVGEKFKVVSPLEIHISKLLSTTTVGSG